MILIAGLIFLRSPLLRAFGVSAFQIIGAPDWTATERYDLVATVPEGRVLSDRDRLPFFEKMLAERWQLLYHRETRNLRATYHPATAFQTAR